MRWLIMPEKKDPVISLYFPVIKKIQVMKDS